MKRYALVAASLLAAFLTGCRTNSEITAGRERYRQENKSVHEITVRLADPNAAASVYRGPLAIPPLVITHIDTSVLYGGRTSRATKNLSFAGPFNISKAGWDPKGNRRWKYIIIHHSATDEGNAAEFNRYHLNRNGWINGLGYDFVIGNGNGSDDGEVEVGSRWKKQIDGAHAGDKTYNQLGIGICMVGDFENEHPSPRQMWALAELVRFLQDKYDIPDSAVLGHKEVRSSGTTLCPGKYFSKKELLKLIHASS